MRGSLFVSLMVAAVSCCRGSNITYSEQAVVSGTLGQNTFSNALVTVTATGTTSVTDNGFGLFSNNSITDATIRIVGIGLATFTEPIYVVDYQPAQTVEIVDSYLHTILGTSDPSFGEYDLRTSFGPVINQAFISPQPPYIFQTDSGLLQLTEVSGNSTFTAVTSVPEPAITGCVALGLFGLYGSFSKRQKRISRDSLPPSSI